MVETPFDVNSKLLKFSYEEFMNVQREKEVIPYKAGGGSLMYAMEATRAHIAFAVNTMSRFMSKASTPYWMAIKRIIRYLKDTVNFKLYLRGKDIVLRDF